VHPVSRSRYSRCCTIYACLRTFLACRYAHNAEGESTLQPSAPGSIVREAQRESSGCGRGCARPAGSSALPRRPPPFLPPLRFEDSACRWARRAPASASRCGAAAAARKIDVDALLDRLQTGNTRRLSTAGFAADLLVTLAPSATEDPGPGTIKSTAYVGLISQTWSELCMPGCLRCMSKPNRSGDGSLAFSLAGGSIALCGALLRPPEVPQLQNGLCVCLPCPRRPRRRPDLRPRDTAPELIGVICSRLKGVPIRRL